ncbi:MAG: proteasome accessory factor PafA2, partial [Actinobacteria bacterium]|nr:proteasome accessory factor PafA2 [Actinomycetota bacterium]
LVSVILENGARYYVDHAHPEYSTPECLDPLALVIHDKAGERVLEKSLQEATAALASGQRILVYKNNSDGKGNSYGCHENYLVSRATPFPSIVKGLTSFLVSRQIFAGAGKVGSEGPGSDDSIEYQISQRADFFEVEVGLETTFKRPLINTRDEPHADPDRYRRLHVIIGDANMSEVATFLKTGTTAIVLKMIEDEFITSDLAMAEPVTANRAISKQIDCRARFDLADGRSITAIDLQWEFLDWAKKYLAGQDVDQVTGDVMHRWEQVIGALETDPMTLDRQLDWVAKYRLLQAYRDRHGLDWDDSKLALVDLQYHDVRQAKGLYYRLVEQGRVETLVDEKDIMLAVSEPPPDTRAYFRGTALKRFSADITAASWDGIVFDTGGESLQKVAMMEPLKGTRDSTEALFVASDTAKELVDHLQG